MYITRLTLANFRNYRKLDVPLPSGLIFLWGDNAQGKSNLLEAIYLLSIGRSHRATNEIELVHWQAAKDEGHAIVAAEVQRQRDTLSLRMGVICRPANQSTGEEASPHVQKQVRVNGVPATISELVGQLAAVHFSTEDVQLIYGPPALRRRFLDILLCQVDFLYLRALQRYQRIVTQRNALLRQLREGKAQADELAVWDNGLSEEGGYILKARLKALERLQPFAREEYASLTGRPENLDTAYEATCAADSDNWPKGLARTLEEMRNREVAAGMTLVGPHRDDLCLTAGRVTLARYASQGEARLVALALRLAEARYLNTEIGDTPVLLLDDVLSELDPSHRQRVLEEVNHYPQVFITTTDLAMLPPQALARATRLQVKDGALLQQG